MPFNFNYDPMPKKRTFFWVEGMRISNEVEEVEFAINSTTFLVRDDEYRRYVINTSEKNGFGEYSWRAISAREEYPTGKYCKEQAIELVRQKYNIPDVEKR
jgi:hypothetical protein